MSEKEETILKRRIWVPACPTCDCACDDEDIAEKKHDVEKLVWEIPGVKKNEIRLDVVNDRVRMVAPRGDNLEYISEYLFSCPADLEKKPNANYADGILSLEVPLKCAHPYDGALHVPIS